MNFNPMTFSRWFRFAYAIRRANSIQAAKEFLLNAESRFPKEAVIKHGGPRRQTAAINLSLTLPGVIEILRLRQDR
jgi:hypothetical protein